MKLLALACVAAVAIAPISADAQTRVRGYVKRDGTYVAPHVRSSPNNTTLDNWTVQPNVNPYNGQPGTRQPDYRPPAPVYRAPPAFPAPTKPKRCTGFYC